MKIYGYVITRYFIYTNISKERLVDFEYVKNFVNHYTSQRGKLELNWMNMMNIETSVSLEV